MCHGRIAVCQQLHSIETSNINQGCNKYLICSDISYNFGIWIDIWCSSMQCTVIECLVYLHFQWQVHSQLHLKQSLFQFIYLQYSKNYVANSSVLQLNMYSKLIARFIYVSRQAVVSHKGMKQHAHASSGLCDHYMYSKLFTWMAGLN